MHRVLRFGKALKELGYQPIIVTSKHIMQGRKDNELVTLAEKHFSEIHYLDHPVDRWIANTIYNNRYGWWSKVVRRFAESVLIPEKNVFWGKAAYRFCKHLIEEDQNIQFVWATMSPFTSGVVATKLTEATGIQSLIDYRDPWMLSHYQKYNSWQRLRNHTLERRMLEKATVVTVNTIPVRELFISYYPDLKHKIHVLTNAWDKDMQFIQPTVQKGEYIDLYYVGSFYKDRQPYTLLEGVKKIESEVAYSRLRLNFIGCSNPTPIQKYTAKLELKTPIHYEGFVAYKQAMQYIQKADVLLLINGTDERNNIFIPAKLFDYLAARKQILFLGDGQASNIIKEVNAGITTSHDTSEIAEALKIAVCRSRQGIQYSEEAFHAYQASTLAKKMLAYIGEI